MDHGGEALIGCEDWDRWNAWADSRIAAALEQHDKLLMEATGAAVGEIRAGIRLEFRKEIEAATAKLSLDLRELIAGLRTELARLETELARRLTSLETETAGLRLRGACRSDQDYDRLVWGEHRKPGCVIAANPRLTRLNGLAMPVIPSISRVQCSSERGVPGRAGILQRAAGLAYEAL